MILLAVRTGTLDVGQRTYKLDRKIAQRSNVEAFLGSVTEANDVGCSGLFT